MKKTLEEWRAEGLALFGEDEMNWRFVCPSCGHVASAKDWKDAGAPSSAVAFNCIGRYTGDEKAAAQKAFKKSGGPCNYSGGGLIGLNPVEIDMGEDDLPVRVFAFAKGNCE